MLLAAGCSRSPPVEADVIIEFEASRYAEWDVEPLLTHFERLWSINIQAGPGAPWFEDPDFYIPDARRVLQQIVDQCRLGEVVFQNQTHGRVSITIEDTDLSSNKIECIRRFERRGLSLETPSGIEALEELRAKGIVPPTND